MNCRQKWLKLNTCQITNTIKQGSGLTPAAFFIYLAALLNVAFKDALQTVYKHDIAHILTYLISKSDHVSPSTKIESCRLLLITHLWLSCLLT